MSDTREVLVVEDDDVGDGLGDREHLALSRSQLARAARDPRHEPRLRLGHRVLVSERPPHELVDVRLGEQIGARREELPQLDVRRPERHELAA